MSLMDKYPDFKFPVGLLNFFASWFMDKSSVGGGVLGFLAVGLGVLFNSCPEKGMIATGSINLFFFRTRF